MASTSSALGVGGSLAKACPNATAKASTAGEVQIDDGVAFCDQFSVCGRVSALPDEPAELINSVRLFINIYFKSFIV